MARVGFAHTVREAGRADPRWLMNQGARVFDLFFGAELYPEAGGEGATTGGRFLLYRFTRARAGAQQQQQQAGTTGMRRAQELAAEKIEKAAPAAAES